MWRAVSSEDARVSLAALAPSQMDRRVERPGNTSLSPWHRALADLGAVIEASASPTGIPRRAEFRPVGGFIHAANGYLFGAGKETSQQGGAEQPVSGD